jgi:hypothetical protein
MKLTLVIESVTLTNLTPVWHRDRAKRMIRNHPEIKNLFGNTPSTAFWCIAFASVQIALAVGLSSQPWWVILLAAWAIGSWIDVNLFQLAHECNHNLVFQENNAKPLALYIHDPAHVYVWTSCLVD